ncbi:MULTISPECIES: hypothetical protein, partial [unclassified Mesorhizobium]|uniref:hypothetical protein n=3 Tax=Mesorhizobium TaxID=68287 RepID=UPI001FDFB90F
VHPPEPARPPSKRVGSAFLAFSHFAAYIAGMSDWTLQALIDAGMSVTGGCLDCHRHQKLDLPALRNRFGADAPAMEWNLKPKMKCAVCGGRRITLTYSPDTSPKDLNRKSAGP